MTDQPVNLQGEPLEGLALAIYNLALSAAKAQWGADIAELRDDVNALTAQAVGIRPGLHSVKA